ncbi:MAG: hypothetical protein C4321_03740, partial [Chloroflexota bacterium]
MTIQPDDVVVAVDIGGTKTLVTVVSAHAEWTSATEARQGVQHAVGFASERQPGQEVRRIVDVVRRLAEDRDIRAVGVAAPGPIDHRSGRIVHSPNLGWRDVNLAAALSDALSAP